MSVTNISYHTRERVQSQRLLHGSVFQLPPRRSCVIDRLFLWYWPLASGSLLVMTRPSGANMPQRKVNGAEWHNRYRRAHPSEAGGASATATQQLIVHRSLSLSRINGRNNSRIVFSGAGIKGGVLCSLQVQGKRQALTSWDKPCKHITFIIHTTPPPLPLFFLHVHYSLRDMKGPSWAW